MSKNLKIFTENIEDEAVNQINELLDQEVFKNCKVRIMPDVHAGKGCVIGFTADLGDKVIPNIVGVDIGCGMLCVELGSIELDLERLDKTINNFIPAGRNIREHRLINFEPINELYCLRELKEVKKFNRAIGTLGGWKYITKVDIDLENGIAVPTSAGETGCGSGTGFADGLVTDNSTSGQRELLLLGILSRGAPAGVSVCYVYHWLGAAAWHILARPSINLVGGELAES